MRRREFIVSFSSALMTPLPTVGATGKRPRIGVLTLLSEQDKADWVAPLAGSLRDLGYIAGQNIDIDYRYADGETDRLEPLARQLIALAPDVVYAGEPSSARAVKRIAPDVPIVCPTLSDRFPDLFANYARPGGSVTGLAIMVEDVNGKLVELVLEVIPGITHIGLLVNPTGASRDFVIQQVGAATRKRGVATVVEEARLPDDLAPAFDRFSSAGARAVIAAPNGMFVNQRATIVRLALASSLPTFFEDRQDVEAGGLLSYGINHTEVAQRAAGLVDRILKGAKPRDLPIEFPTKLELVVNLKTARFLNLTVPPSLLSRADEVIE